jgi:nitrite reductase/ring-hydroxylating ferredoxin subunit
MEDGTTRPFSIFVVRSQTDQCLGYVNVCPHQGAWLNIGEGRFFTDNGQRLRCGRHKAEFEIDTGLCVKGPCRDKTIEPIALIVIDGEICLCGVDLAEEEIVDADELDETMEIMIHPG